MNSVKLGDICAFINGGSWNEKAYVRNGIPVLKVSNCRNNGFQIEDLDYLPETLREKYKQNELHLNDVIIATVGSHPNLKDSAAGRCAIVSSLVEGFYLNQNAVCLRTKDNTILDQIYLGVLCRYFPFQHYIQMRGKGAANQMRIAIGLIKEYKFNLPDIDVQKRIADILSNYDALIENNQRQIKLLEEASRRLYREWFVDLRFPGHEHVQIVDGVPEGWSTVRVADCLQYHINGGWGKETPIGKNVHPARVIRGTDINDIKMGDFAELPLRFHTQNDIEKRTLKGNDLVFELSNGNINNIGRSLFVDDLILAKCGENTICASFCKLFRPKNKMYSLMLYWEIQHMQSSGEMLLYKKQGSNGINNFAFDSFLEHQFLIPNQESLWMPFECIMRKITNAQRQLTISKEARDRLLPKLMSGEIEL